MTMDRAALTASTPATRADAWSTAENTALASAIRLEDDARIAREHAGELAGRPDMRPAAQRLDDEATAAEHDAAQRRGLAQGYAAIRTLQSGDAATTNPGAALTPLTPQTEDVQSRERQVTCPTCQGSGTSGPNHLAPNGTGVCTTCKGDKTVSAQRADWETTRSDQCDDEAECDDEPIEPEVFTHCYECDEPLDAPTTDENKSVHPDCDLDTPPKYWMGGLAADGKSINQDEAESYRKVENLAIDAVDMVLEWETPYGETFISLPDGSIVDARTWIEQPENLELAGGRDQYAGKGEFDPAAPNRCWMGQTLPSGRIARPLARSFDNVEDLAAKVCEEAFTTDHMSSDNPYTVMLPGGELVDAKEWAHRPETRQVAGYLPVQVDPNAPGQCWMGPTPKDEPESAPIEKLATPYNDVTDLATEVCRRVFEVERGHDKLSDRSAPLTVMLPNGDLVNAYEWAQQSDTQRLAGYTPVEVDPDDPNRCWLGQSSDGGAPVRQLATSSRDKATMAANVCAAIFEDDSIHSRTSHVVMLPGGELVNAYNWAQQPETRHLAGVTTVRNRVQFEATARCKSCDKTITCESERIVQGEIGEQRAVDGVLTCESCGDHLWATPVPVTLVDDASAATDQPPRRI